MVVVLRIWKLRRHLFRSGHLIFQGGPSDRGIKRFQPPKFLRQAHIGGGLTSLFVLSLLGYFGLRGLEIGTKRDIKGQKCISKF